MFTPRRYGQQDRLRRPVDRSHRGDAVAGFQNKFDKGNLPSVDTKKFFDSFQKYIPHGVM
jgi:hypothetical protein